jgi:hypothetical protein
MNDRARNEGAKPVFHDVVLIARRALDPSALPNVVA